MAYQKQIVCFANSWKKGGSCVAGREIVSQRWGGWVRPVSTRPDHEISALEQLCTDRHTAGVLDIIDIGFQAPQPHEHQQENHVIDGTRWVRRGVATWAEVQGAVEDPGGPLWLNDASSAYGLNDKVAEAELPQFNRSLYLVRPEGLRIIVRMEGGYMYPAKRKVRADFRLCGESYCLSVTDPVASGRFPAEGETPLDHALLCVSLSEVLPNDGHAYKLVAALITP